MGMADDNKDFIINLRVSRATYEKIRDRAKANGETVSNLIRTVLSDSGEIIDDLSRDVFGGKGKRAQSFDDVVSYHKAQIARETVCAKCGKKMRAGSAATVGETASARKYYFCPDCR